MNNNYDNIPSWKQEMAKEAMKSEVSRYFKENVKPVYTETREMYNKTCEQAAKENGYASGREYLNDIQWTKNPSEKMQEKFKAVQTRWEELYRPYADKAWQAGQQFNEKQNSLIMSHIREFDRIADKLLSDVQVIRRAGDELAIRCKMDGMQQSGETLDKTDTHTLRENGASEEILMQMAQKYFRYEIQKHMGEQQDTGLKRSF